MDELFDEVFKNDMTVDGVAVSKEKIAKAVRMIASTRSPFILADMIGTLQQYGVDWQASYRAADRVLQKLKKSGHIKFSAGQWKWI